MTGKRPIRLFLDWDGTIALTDTLSIIAAIGYSKNAHRPLPPWSYFTESYISDYSAHASSYRPQKSDRRSIARELAWLESLIDVERASIERVEAAGVFANMTALDVQRAALRAAEKGEIQLRPGLKELVEAVLRTQGCACIISVNWSATFITEVLKSATAMERWCWPFEEVHANEIIFGGNGRLNRVFGKENRGIWTAKDKSRILKEAATKEGQHRLNVYVGDSLTDLNCLLSVDVGICVRDEPLGGEQKSLAKALMRLGISTRWILEYDLPNEEQDDSLIVSGKVLWWARDFKEVAQSPLFTDALRWRSEGLKVPRPNNSISPSS